MYPGATAFFTSPSLKWDNRAIELRPFLRGRGDVLNPRWAGGFRLRIADDLGVLLLLTESLSLCLSLSLALAKLLKLLSSKKNLKKFAPTEVEMPFGVKKEQ